MTTLKMGDGQNTDPQSMDYPKMDATKVYCDYKVRKLSESGST